jgi:hypothetical protein
MNVPLWGFFTMTKSSLYHDRDGEAIDALRRVLPNYWIYKETGNKFGGKEYSEDLVIEIVNDDAKRTVTGVEFGIQNKTGVDIRKDHVRVTLKTEDVRRLMGLQRPVLIHGYHIGTKTSYWRWLNEWYPLNVDKLKAGKSVAIIIPKDKVLDVSAVEEIEHYARWEHAKHQARRTADFIIHNHASDYQIEVKTGKTDIKLVVNPKHEGAIPKIDILDQAEYENISRAIETGVPIPLTSAFLVSNVPEVLHDSFGTTFDSVWLIPLASGEEELPLKVEFFDDSETVVIKTSYLNMKLIQPGTIISRWEGTDTRLGITYTFTFDRKAETSQYTIQIKPLPKDLKQLREYLALLDRLYLTRRVRFTNLKTEVVRESEKSFFKEANDMEKTVRHLADALFAIEEKLNISIPFPDRVDKTLLLDAAWIIEALRDGFIKVKKDLIPEDQVLTGMPSAQMLQQILSEFEKSGKVPIPLPYPLEDVKIEFLGHSLDLGLARYICDNARIINADQLQEKLTEDVIINNVSIETVFEVDTEEIYLIFDNWFRQADSMPHAG